MWSLVVAAGMFVIGLVFSFAKVSSRAEKITESHSKELNARKNQKETLTHRDEQKKSKV